MLRRAVAVLLTVVGFAVVVVVAVAPATAAPPPSSGGTGCSSPTLTGPATVRVGDTYTVQGCGFAPGGLVPLEITESGGCCVAYNLWADESGRLSITRTANGSGYYRIRASAQRRNGRWIAVAEWSANVS